MPAPSCVEEDAFLAALVARDAHRIGDMLALHPEWAHTVRSCRQPTIHFLLQNGGGDDGDVPCQDSDAPTSDGEQDDVADTIACIDLLVAHGAALDAIDATSGNSVLHSIVAPRQPPPAPPAGIADCPTAVVFEAHVVSVLQYLIGHSCRPSLHCLNRLGFTAAGYACHVGNVAAVDALFAMPLNDALHCGAVLAEAAAADSGLDRTLCGLPLAVAMGVSLQQPPTRAAAGASNDGRHSDHAVCAFSCHSMPWIAAQQGQHAVLRYLLALRVDVAMVSRVVVLEGRGGYTSAARKVPFFELEPLPWMATGGNTEWQRVGAPLHVACSHYRDGSANAKALLTTVALMLRYMHAEHITDAEREEEAARVAEPFHDHIPQKTPAAVFRVLRAQDAAGRCAMHHAADGKHDGTVQLMEYLLSMDPTLLQAVDRGGRTPLDAALKGNKTTNADWLVQRFGVKCLGQGTFIRGTRPQRTC